MPRSRKPHWWVPSPPSSPHICIWLLHSRIIKRFYCLLPFSSSSIAKKMCLYQSSLGSLLSVANQFHIVETRSLAWGFISTDICWVAFSLKLLRLQLWRPQIYSFAADVLLMPLIWKLEIQWNGCVTPGIVSGVLRNPSIFLMSVP